MENLELITFDKNGQGVVNWESLESLTSLEFVDSIKENINFWHQYGKEVIVTAITPFNHYVDVLLVEKGCSVKMYSFDKSNNSFYHSEWLSLPTVEDFVHALGGTVSWPK